MGSAADLDDALYGRSGLIRKQAWEPGAEEGFSVCDAVAPVNGDGVWAMQRLGPGCSRDPQTTAEDGRDAHTDAGARVDCSRTRVPAQEVLVRLLMA